MANAPAEQHLVQGRPEVLGDLVSHLGTTSVAETLVRLVAADSATDHFLPQSKLGWLPGSGTLQQLLDLCALLDTTVWREHVRCSSSSSSSIQQVFQITA